MKSPMHLLVPDLSADLTLLSIVLRVLMVVLALVRVVTDMLPSRLLALRPREDDRARVNLRGTLAFFPFLGPSSLLTLV